MTELELYQKLQRLDPKDALDAIVSLNAELFRSDLYLLSKYLVGYKDVSWQAHGEIITALETPSPRKLIVIPRGCFKSSLGVVSYSIWRLIRNPNLRILLDSELYQNSKNFLGEIKNHLKSEQFRRLYGEFEGDKWNEGEITIRQRTQVLKEASVTVGGVGTTKVGQHYDLIIGDDYNSPKNSDSPEKCQQIIDHYRYNLNILEPTGEYVLIGTRYAERDVIGFVLREILGQKDLAEGNLTPLSLQVQAAQQLQALSPL